MNVRTGSKSGDIKRKLEGSGRKPEVKTGGRNRNLKCGKCTVLKY
jgi:hypothetical protein